MNTFAKGAVETATTGQTENGDKTYLTSLNACVDLFFNLAAMRAQPTNRILEQFSAAYAAEPELATRILLWVRDIREGAGERRIFKEILQYLELHDRERLYRVFAKTPELGRWDDFFCFFDPKDWDKTLNQTKKLIADTFYKALVNDKNGLAAKWSPRLTSKHKHIAQFFRSTWGLNPSQYRRLVNDLTKVVETQMCNREWGEINYSHVPSVAMSKYAKAFKRHDEARFVGYLESVKKGETKINTQALYPYDVTKSSLDPATADALWNNLPDFVPEGLNFLPICDVSGSMARPIGKNTGVTALNACIALGMYCAERNKSAFKDLMITFSDKPAISMIPKGTIREKVAFISRQTWAMNTNLDAAMQLIVDIGTNNNVPVEDMPTHLLIMSDMEFDAASGDRYYDSITRTYKARDSSVSERTRKRFEEAGYPVPNIVWWNLVSRNQHVPVRAGQDGAALVSGFSPSIMKSLLKGDMNPIAQMLATVTITRYDH